jgi:eukaryotic-like serine/threonine-protein kinase
MSQLRISIGQNSNKGVKSENEDSYGVYTPRDSLLDSKGIAAVIADGMGSCQHPKEASEYCVKGFFSDYYSTAESWSVKTSGAKVLTALNSWLYSKSRDDQAKSMVSTFSALIIKSTTAYIFHAGDSRIYRYRQGTLEQLTQDHRVWMGKTQNYLSRAMGIDVHLDIDYKTLDVEPADIFIMTTDGVHDYVHDAAMKLLLTESSDLDEMCRIIVERALTQGSEDNVTCQMLRIETLPSRSANEVYNELTRLPFPPELEPGMEIDGYKILREINASARSQIYLVADIASGKHMVMKTPSVNFSDDPAYIERFYMEEWAGKRIYHPHVQVTYELQRPRHFMYFLLEYIEGQTLAEWISANPRPEISAVTRIIEQIILGLRAIHRMEMLHRDLKPDNIMITAQGAVKIIDFGSVKVAGIAEISSPVEQIELLGTRHYTAPEYLLGLAGNDQSDLFSLGVITYEMLTGKLPYGDQLTKNIHWKNINRLRYIPAISINPMVPLWIDGALEKCLLSSQSERYETSSEFFHDLTHPNEKFMRRQIPLLEKNPLRVWQIISISLLMLNLLLLYVLLSRP